MGNRLPRLHKPLNDDAGNNLHRLHKPLNDDTGNNLPRLGKPPHDDAASNLPGLDKPPHDDAASNLPGLDKPRLGRSSVKKSVLGFPYTGFSVKSLVFDISVYSILAIPGGGRALEVRRWCHQISGSGMFTILCIRALGGAS